MAIGYKIWFSITQYIEHFSEIIPLCTWSAYDVP